MSVDPTKSAPPSLSAGTPPAAPTTPPPATPPPGPPSDQPPYDDEDLLDDDDEQGGNAPDVAPLPKPTFTQQVLDNKMMAAGVLVVLLFIGLYFWYDSAVTAAENAPPPSAVSVEGLTQAPQLADAMDPMSATEQSLDRDRPQPEQASADIILSQTGTADEQGTGPNVPLEGTERPATRQQQADYRSQAAFAGRANNTDSVTVTTRDPNTGQFVQTRQARQRVPLSRGESSPRSGGVRSGGQSYRRAESFSEVTPQNQSARQPVRVAPRPTHAPDGVPYETNDEINMMIAGLPVEVQAQYERMSGRRYRPLPANVDQSGGRDRRNEMAYIPGMDGFNTIRYRGSNAGAEEETPIPDIFYRCSVLGTQQIRTGSVVELRLQEDATFEGITYPRNMVFSALATVETNRVMLDIQRLGTYRVKVQTFNYAYMPGIMIDPGKRQPSPDGGMGGALQQGGYNEISQAISQSQQAANSWQGIAGRVGVTLISRAPRAGQKLRLVTLPDGYPLLLSQASAGSNGGTASGPRQGGVNAPTGLQGQTGNPFQSLLMSGEGQGGYQGNLGTVPPLYYRPAPAQQR